MAGCHFSKKQTCRGPMPMQMGLVLWDRANPDCGTGNADKKACKMARRRPAMKRTGSRSQLLFRVNLQSRFRCIHPHLFLCHWLLNDHMSSNCEYSDPFDFGENREVIMWEHQAKIPQQQSLILKHTWYHRGQWSYHDWTGLRWIYHRRDAAVLCKRANSRKTSRKQQPRRAKSIINTSVTTMIS